MVLKERSTEIKFVTEINGNSVKFTFEATKGTDSYIFLKTYSFYIAGVVFSYEITIMKEGWTFIIV